MGHSLCGTTYGDKPHAIRREKENTPLNRPNFLASRRAFVRTVAAAPILASFAVEDLIATVRGSKENVYTRIGVRPLINARGTWTYLSGSLELPEVRQAKQEAALHFVDMFELQHGVGKRLAELSGAESGMVTSGAAGAMAAATAACIAGSDPKKIWQLPDTTGLKDEVVMFGGRSAFDSAIRLAGGKLVWSRGHMRNSAALSMTKPPWSTQPRSARNSKRRLRSRRSPAFRCCSTMRPAFHQSKISLLRPDGHRPVRVQRRQGTGGPQCSGLLLGRKDLIEAALANCCRGRAPCAAR